MDDVDIIMINKCVKCLTMLLHLDIDSILPFGSILPSNAVTPIVLPIDSILPSNAVVEGSCHLDVAASMDIDTGGLDDVLGDDVEC